MRSMNNWEWGVGNKIRGDKRASPLHRFYRWQHRHRHRHQLFRLVGLPQEMLPREGEGAFESRMEGKMGSLNLMYNLGTDRFRHNLAVRWVVTWVRLLLLCLFHPTFNPPSEDCEDTTQVGGGTVSGPE